MMNKFVAALIAAVCCLALVNAECPNACSAHGKCGPYDMCTCYRNWMANDCSERICQFGLAHVDTPKGDLDSSSGALSDPSVRVVVNDAMYPYGTTEQYPAGTDSDGTVLTNYAHEYRECSNKGICDRSTGTCACFEGYDGSACQRASCPSGPNGMCSGHGTCHTISEIADMDSNNVYRLWDEASTMGCVCDSGYSGADCSQRVCKSGVDPLYYDEYTTLRYSNYTYELFVRSSGVTLTGNYSLVFYDSFGEDWQTVPIHWNASCTTVINALEGLPNDVIPWNSVRCYKSEQSENGADHSSDPIYDANVYIKSKYTIAFPRNPGKLEQISINKYLDGSRPTLFSDEASSTLGWHIYPNGFIGEDYDMVPDLCEGVTVTLNSASTSHYLGITDTQAIKALKKCLGDSDGLIYDNVEVYNWDYGNYTYPHLIKLVDATQDFNLAVDSSYTAYDGAVRLGVNDDFNADLITDIYPKTKLCDNSDGNKALFGQDGHGVGFCSNKNPAGFYAVLVYDATNFASNPFRLYTRAAVDYSSTTKFHVYTTTGWLQLVNPNTKAYTVTWQYTNAQKAATYYSDTLHLTNGSYVSGYLGNIDCETNSIGSNGALACLNKDDYVMVLSTASTMTSTLLGANPVYPNLYQVKRVGREERRYDSLNVNSEPIRHVLQLDYSLNAKYTFGGSSDTSAFVYKFFPPTLNGYHHTAECSNRGICNSDTGVCECFHGYTSDDCSVINALAA